MSLDKNLISGLKVFFTYLIFSIYTSIKLYILHLFGLTSNVLAIAELIQLPLSLYLLGMLNRKLWNWD